MINIYNEQNNEPHSELPDDGMQKYGDLSDRAKVLHVLVVPVSDGQRHCSPLQRPDAWEVVEILTRHVLWRTLYLVVRVSHKQRPALYGTSPTSELLAQVMIFGDTPV